MRRTFVTDLRLHCNEVLIREEGELTFELNPQKSKPRVLIDQEGTLWILHEYPNSVERYAPVQGGPVECVYTRKGGGNGQA
jgi:hypothetical protein